MLWYVQACCSTLIGLQPRGHWGYSCFAYRFWFHMFLIKLRSELCASHFMTSIPSSSNHCMGSMTRDIILLKYPIVAHGLAMCAGNRRVLKNINVHVPCCIEMTRHLHQVPHPFLNWCTPTPSPHPLHVCTKHFSANSSLQTTLHT